MHRSLESLLRLCIPCCLVPALASCSFILPVAITGRILDIDRLDRKALRPTFEEIYTLHNEITPDSVAIDDDGSFALSHTFRDVLPQTLTLHEGSSVVAKLVIRTESDSVVFVDPVDGSRQTFQYDGHGPLNVRGLRIVPAFDSVSLARLNVDRLLTGLEYSDREIVVHFASIPPRGSRLRFWGGYGRIFVDTTIAVADSVVRLDSRFFWNDEREENVFGGGSFMNPYGWFQPFASFDCVGHPGYRN